MKKITLLLLLLSNLVFSQNQELDAKFEKILAEKNDDIRIDKLYLLTGTTSETDATITLKIAQKLLIQGQKRNDKITETFAISLFSYQALITGNKTKSLKYALKSLEMAEKIGNNNLLAITKNRVAHNYLDPVKKKELYKEALKNAELGKNVNFQQVISKNIGAIYTKMGVLDSGLFYLQKSEQLMSSKKFTSLQSSVYLELGNTYAKMKSTELAKAYYNLALKKSKEENTIRNTTSIYYNLADFYYKLNQVDSTIVYAKKAIEIVDKTPFSNDVMRPSKLLKDIYRNKNNDLAMKYADMYQMANDSLNNLQSLQRNQLLTFEEDLRQQELVKVNLEANEQEKENLQYIFIAIGILSLIILFLLLSRSFITNTRLIHFCGIVGLLIVFEFLNLLLHPFLEKITHHSPILLLLGLVGIASLLVPLHHKVEHWATAKLVAKNKEIRLAKAQKTIEELAIKTENS